MQPLAGHPRGGNRSGEFAQLRQAALARFAALEQRLQLLKNVDARPLQPRQSQDGCRLLVGRSCRGGQFHGNSFGADLRQFVECPQHVVRLLGQTFFFQQPVQDLPIVHPNRELFKTECSKQIVDHEHRFDVGRGAGGADRVEVALHKLAIAASLSVFAAPDVGDLIPFERRAQLLNVLGHEPRQRHRKIKPQADCPAAMILELIELLVGLRASFTDENVQMLQRRRVDGGEPVGAIHLPGRLDDPLPRNHRRGRIIAETF